MTNLAIFSFNQHWFHLGSLLEATMTNHSQYESISYFIFDSVMPLPPLDLHCRFPGRSTFGIVSPEEKVASYLTHNLGNKVQVHHIDISRKIPNETHLAQKLFRDLQSQDDIESFSINDMAVGMAIKSHLISKTRDSQPNLDEFHGTALSALKTYLRLYHWYQNNRTLKLSSEVWICNGRPFHERIMREISEVSKKKIRYYEIGGEGQIPKRWILHSSSPHDRILHQVEVKSHCELHGYDERAIDTWFRSRRDKSENQHYREGEKFTLSRLKEPYVIFFSSSEDEVAAIAPSWRSVWADQISAVRGLMEAIEKQSTFSLVVRVHPNQANKSKNDQKRWRKIKSTGRTTVFSQDSTIDSYALLDRAKAVIVFQSTIGVEAAHQRKPLAYLAPTRYDHLIPCKRLESVDEISTWIQSLSTIKDEDIETNYSGARQWINYMVSAGNVWRILEIHHKGRRTIGLLSQRDLRPNNLIIVITRIYLRLKQWNESIKYTVELELRLSLRRSARRSTS